MEKGKKPELIIVGGPNGSGKTTLANEFLANRKEYLYLSADNIASEINPKNPAKARLQAGKKFFKRFRQALEEKQNLLIESTLSGKSLGRGIKRAKEKDYIVTLIFIFLDDENMCVERVKTRVDKGGHHVPKSDIIRRFGRSILNFWSTYRQQAHRWLLYYNTEESFQEVANKEEKNLYIYDDSLFDIFKELVDQYE